MWKLWKETKYEFVRGKIQAEVKNQRRRKEKKTRSCEKTKRWKFFTLAFRVIAGRIIFIPLIFLCISSSISLPSPFRSFWVTPSCYTITFKKKWWWNETMDGRQIFLFLCVLCDWQEGFGQETNFWSAPSETENVLFKAFLEVLFLKEDIRWFWRQKSFNDP